MAVHRREIYYGSTCFNFPPCFGCVLFLFYFIWAQSLPTSLLVPLLIDERIVHHLLFRETVYSTVSHYVFQSLSLSGKLLSDGRG